MKDQIALKPDKNRYMYPSNMYHNMAKKLS